MIGVGSALRSTFEHGDGYVVKKTRRYKRPVPAWAQDNQVIRSMLLKAFPKIASGDPRERQRAGRWSRVIYLYFQSGMSYSEVAEEMDESLESIKGILRALR